MAGEPLLTIVGNLTADPELRYTQNGLAVANFTIAATPRDFDKQANEWKDGEALFLRASVWRDFAEHAAASLTKGARVVATGRLKSNSYTDKEGNSRTSMELDIEDIGPSLKYATAQVTRSQSSGTQQNNQQRQQGGQPRQAPPQQGGGYQGPPQGGYQGPPQGQQPPAQQGGGQWQQPAANDEPWATPPAAQGGGQAGWNTPGSYSDETPF